MADISYTPTTWADGSEGGTPIDAAKLNNIESGISDAVAAIGPNDTTADGTLKAQIDALGESVSLINATNITLGTWANGAEIIFYTDSAHKNGFIVSIGKSGYIDFYALVNDIRNKQWSMQA